MLDFTPKTPACCSHSLQSYRDIRQHLRPFQIEEPAYIQVRIGMSRSNKTYRSCEGVNGGSIISVLQDEMSSDSVSNA